MDNVVFSLHVMSDGLIVMSDNVTIEQLMKLRSELDYLIDSNILAEQRARNSDLARVLREAFVHFSDAGDEVMKAIEELHAKEDITD
jgi:hypothetical protein